MISSTRARGLGNAVRQPGNCTVQLSGGCPRAQTFATRALPPDDLKKRLRTAIELEELSCYANVHAGTSTFASLTHLVLDHVKLLKDQQLAAQARRYGELSADARRAVVGALRAWLGAPDASSRFKPRAPPAAPPPAAARPQAPTAGAAASLPPVPPTDGSSGGGAFAPGAALRPAHDSPPSNPAHQHPHSTAPSTAAHRAAPPFTASQTSAPPSTAAPISTPPSTASQTSAPPSTSPLAQPPQTIATLTSTPTFGTSFGAPATTTAASAPPPHSAAPSAPVSTTSSSSSSSSSSSWQTWSSPAGGPARHRDASQGSVDYPLIASTPPRQLPAQLVQRANKLTAGGERHVFFIDLETTSKYAKDAMITQLYIHHQQSNSALNIFVYPFRNTTRTLDPAVADLTNISLEFLQDLRVQPFDVQAAQPLLEWMLDRMGPEGGVPVLVAHNGYTYDIPVLVRHWKECGFTVPASWLHFDTVRMYRKFVKKLGYNPALHRGVPSSAAEDMSPWRASSTLQNLRALYGLDVAGDAHRADGDVQVLREVADKIAQELGKSDYMGLLEHINRGVFELPAKQNILGPANSDADVGPTSTSSTSSQFTAVTSSADLLASTSSTSPQVTPASSSADLLASTSSTSSEAVAVDAFEAKADGDRPLVAGKAKGRKASSAASSPLPDEGVERAKDSTAGEEAEGGAGGGGGEKPPTTKAGKKAKGGGFRYRLNGEEDEVLWRLGPLQITAKEAAEAWGPCTIAFAEWENVADTSKASSLKELQSTVDAGFANVLELLMHVPRVYEAVSRTLMDKEQQSVLIMVHEPKLQFKRLAYSLKAVVPVDWSPAGYAIIQGTKFSRFQPPAFADKTRALLKAPLKRVPGPVPKFNCNDGFDIWASSSALAASADPLHVFATYPARKPFKPEDFAGKGPKQGLQPRLLAALAGTPGAQDPLPDGVVEREGLTGWLEALQVVHQPPGTDDWRAVLDSAKYRLGFQEIFFLQLSMLLQRSALQGRLPAGEEPTPSAPPLTKATLLNAAIKGLPFTLTKAQKKALQEIRADAALDRPMLRLLQGDVGSGKTAVAILFMLLAVASGCQGALLAPTELLASQHFETLQQWIKYLPERMQKEVSVSLLIGNISAKNKQMVKDGLADGTIKMVVGTHALLYVEKWHKLGAVVIDEQHRFGVKQRESLVNTMKNVAPHVLSMTATPIPRSLALVVFGSCAHSVLNELPPGRKPIITEVVLDSPVGRQMVYEVIKAEVLSGGRAYIVCPLVEESEKESMKDILAATALHKELQESDLLEGVAVGLVHGRVASNEKEKAMQEFKSGATPVLVSTTVVEVGVDVPEASVMVVQHAERFGLAQLHQLRGRVGRGERQSRCYLMTASSSAERLQVMQESNDGFVVAEADLAFRGHGDLLGTRQSGRNLSKLAEGVVLRHPGIVEKARTAAEEVLETTGGTLTPRLMAAIHAYGFTHFDEVTGLGA